MRAIQVLQKPVLNGNEQGYTFAQKISTLALLVARVGADDTNHAFAAHHLAVAA